MIGGFQVGPFQPAYQQVGTPTPPPQEINGGGGDRRRLRRKKRLYPAFKPSEPQEYQVDVPSLRPVEAMSQVEIHQEMSMLLHRALRKDEEERAVLLLLAMLT